MRYNSFSSEPQIEVNPKNPNKPFTLLNDITYLSGDYCGKEIIRIEIKKGYNWNGADILTPFWSIIGYSQSSPEILPASLIHDWLCEHQKYIPKDGVRISSDIFKNILILYGVPKYKALIMTAAVRLWQTIVGDWNK